MPWLMFKRMNCAKNDLCRSRKKGLLFSMWLKRLTTTQAAISRHAQLSRFRMFQRYLSKLRIGYIGNGIENTFKYNRRIEKDIVFHHDNSIHCTNREERDLFLRFNVSIYNIVEIFPCIITSFHLDKFLFKFRTNLQYANRSRANIMDEPLW